MIGLDVEIRRKTKRITIGNRILIKYYKDFFNMIGKLYSLIR